jgi:Tol biopolymer transport system component
MRFRNSLRLSCFILYTLFPILAFGQYYNLGQDPASLKWRQIITPDFKIIYPASFEQKAKQMLPALDFIKNRGNKTLDYHPKRVPLIIHNYNITSNAVTAWAPARVELYTSPPQDSYAQDWLNQLIFHEYRHVVQIDRNNQGFTKVLSWFTGEQAATMINGLFVPAWFMEGDAVCTETALSQSGRGRIPSFEMLLRSQVLQKGAFTYDKAAFGSYKTFVPNKYVLGYSLVANVRRRYGYQAWVTALDEVARKPFLITPFNLGLKKAAGFSKEKLYSITMSDMDSMWKYQDARTEKSKFDQLTVINDKDYGNYKFPDFLDDSLVVAEYTNLDDITRFVVVSPNGNSEILATPGFLSSEKFSIIKINPTNQTVPKTDRIDSGDNYLLAWTETIDDPRWEQRNYSVVRIYDVSSGKVKSLTARSRYFAPAFSPDGLKLAVVSVDPDNRSSIVLIDAKSGEETGTILASDSDFYMTPSWAEGGSKIVFTKLDGNGKSICVYDFENGEIIPLLPPTYVEISNPVFAREYVLFNGSYSGIENIYAIDLNSKEILQVTSAEFGASNARLSPDGKKMVYSNYSSSGNHLVETGFSPASWRHLNTVKDFSPSLYRHLVTEESAFAGIQVEDSSNYESQPYKKFNHIFNFHSWAPAYINYMTGENGTGISFMSQNELSTVTTTVGYLYDITENTGKVTGNISWAAWYPVIDLNTSYGARAAYTGGDTLVRYNFNETSISGGFTLPLLFTGGKYYKGLRFRLHTTWNNITDNTSPDENKLTGTINTIDYSFSAYRYIKQSGKDLYPRWGQYITGTYRHSPFGKNDLGSIISAGTRLYFPGLMLHQGIRIDVNLQVKDPGHYAYSNQIAMPRGYLSVNENQLTSFAINYKFPFAYPDFAVGPLVYLKRLKANLFYDGGIGTTHGESQKLQSTGVEITSDLHILRFVFPVDIGFRFGYRPIEKQYFSDFLFSVNLSN